MLLKNTGSETVRGHPFIVLALSLKLWSFAERMEKLGDRDGGGGATHSTFPEA